MSLLYKKGRLFEKIDTAGMSYRETVGCSGWFAIGGTMGCRCEMRCFGVEREIRIVYNVTQKGVVPISDSDARERGGLGHDAYLRQDD